MSTFKRRKMNLGAKLRCLLQMNKMNLGAQCFDLDMVITWPNMTKINLGAKLKCAINEQKLTSVRNASNSRWWQNFQIWTSMRSWDALKMNKNKLRCVILRIQCGDKMTEMNLGAKLRCAKNDKTWTSVHNVSWHQNCWIGHVMTLWKTLTY